ncbi:MGMT family protein [Streptomyces sp. NRRL S-337]|uniref:MGMT family protein n=1 Tax=Streptomyces sp. NRRL S-337 TaxID=1463900 RepID=UPI00099B8B42|nr:MGMT family protein [Streptomyces sp. NRRL S-337]
MSGTGDTAPGADAGELPAYAERVLSVAELIPAGRVMTYGDVAEYLAEEGQPEGLPGEGGGGRRVGGPRQVGRVMALYGGAVPWWRVVRADGKLLPGSELRALAHYRDEGTPLRSASVEADDHIPRLDMRRARWDGRPDDPDDPDGRPEDRDDPDDRDDAWDD